MVVSMNFVSALLTSLLAAGVTGLSIMAITRFQGWANRQISYFISFAAGVLVSVSFLHLVPESLRINPQAPLYILVGFFAFHGLNRFLATYVCNKIAPENPETIRLGLLPLISIGMHSFLDGVIYSVTYHVSIFTGLISAIGLVLHEFPEGIITFLLLSHSGISKRKAVILAFLAAGMSTPLGMLISYPFIEMILPSTLGIMLALTAGALTYTGASHLLPETEHYQRKYSFLAMLAGMLTALAVVIFYH